MGILLSSSRGKTRFRAVVISPNHATARKQHTEHCICIVTSHYPIKSLKGVADAKSPNGLVRRHLRASLSHSCRPALQCFRQSQILS